VRHGTFFQLRESRELLLGNLGKCDVQLRLLIALLFLFPFQLHISIPFRCASNAHDLCHFVASGYSGGCAFIRQDFKIRKKACIAWLCSNYPHSMWIISALGAELGAGYFPARSFASFGSTKNPESR